MKKILFTVSVLLFYIITAGQTVDSSIRELLDCTSYAKDTSAEALIIYDKGETHFLITDNGFEMEFKRKCRVKIFKASGIDHSEIKIALYTDGYKYEEINSFSSRAFNLNDSIISETEGSKKELMKETINKNWIRKVISVPGVKEGSVFDFEYTITSPYLFNLQDWEFQHDIPILYSEYITKMIPFYTYTYLTIGTNKFDEFESFQEKGLPHSFRGIKYNNMVYKFVMKDLSAFKDVAFISTPTDYQIKIDFQLSKIFRTDGSTQDIITTWPNLIKDLTKQEEFGKYIKSLSKESKRVLAGMKPLNTDKMKLADELIQYVKSNYKWSGREGYFATENSKTFLRTKTGNTANVNLFLCALLKEAEIDATPVILSTRDHGRIYNDYPFAHFFNYVVVLSNINGRMILSDATEKNTTFDQLPERCINDKGLVVSRDDVKWVSLVSKIPSKMDQMFQFSFNESNDSLNCAYTLNAISYDAIREKKEYHADPEDYLKSKTEEVFDEVQNSLVNASDTLKNFRLNILGNLPTSRIDNYVSVLPFLNMAISENPFNQKKRDYPIDMIYARTRTFTSVIKLPAGAKQINIPKSNSISNDLFAFEYSVSEYGDQIMVSANYQFKSPIYEAASYAKLQYYFETLIKHLNQPVTIELQD